MAAQENSAQLRLGEWQTSPDAFSRISEMVVEHVKIEVAPNDFPSTAVFARMRCSYDIDEALGVSVSIGDAKCPSPIWGHHCMKTV